MPANAVQNLFRRSEARRLAQAGLLDINWPWNVRDLIRGIDADYERVAAAARSAKLPPAELAQFEIEFQRWKTFYKDNQDPGFFSSSHATVEQARERAARLGEWQRKLGVGGPDVTPPPQSGPLDRNGLLVGVAVAAGLLYLAGGARK